MRDRGNERMKWYLRQENERMRERENERMRE